MNVGMNLYPFPSKIKIFRQTKKLPIITPTHEQNICDNHSSQQVLNQRVPNARVLLAHTATNSQADECGFGYKSISSTESPNSAGFGTKRNRTIWGVRGFSLNFVQFLSKNT